MTSEQILGITHAHLSRKHRSIQREIWCRKERMLDLSRFTTENVCTRSVMEG